MTDITDSGTSFRSAPFAVKAATATCMAIVVALIAFLVPGHGLSWLIPEYYYPGWVGFCAGAGAVIGAQAGWRGY